MCPEKYKVSVAKKAVITFANNDVPHLDPTGADHESFSYGLKKSLHNYLHALCLDNPLHTWFDFKTPKPTVAEDFILKCLEEEELNSFKSTARIVFFGHLPHVERQSMGNAVATVCLQQRARRNKTAASRRKLAAGATKKSCTAKRKLPHTATNKRQLRASRSRGLRTVLVQ
jgi:hypothetical protein